jgi:hypothetical protein
MDRSWAATRYRTRLVEGAQDGWIALALTAHAEGEPARLARVTFWDAQGQFSLEMFVDELPLVIVEELMDEAKRTIAIR